LYRTTDGGKTWADVSPGDSVQMFYDVELFDTKTGLVIGMDRGSEVPYAGIAYRTTDGGKTWKKQKRLGLGYSEIFYRPGGDVYFLSFGQLHRSKDKGKTWQTIKAAPENRARALSFFGKSGLMAGLEGMCGISSDSGKTWTTVKLDKNLTFVAAELVNEKAGYIAGLNDKLFATTDGGKTWNPELPAKMFTILDMCKIGDRLYAVGTDGGMMYKVIK